MADGLKVYCDVTTKIPNEQRITTFQKDVPFDLEQWKFVLEAEHIPIIDEFIVAYKSSPSFDLVSSFESLLQDTGSEYVIFVPTWKLISLSYSEIQKNSAMTPSPFGLADESRLKLSDAHMNTVMFHRWKWEIKSIIFKRLHGKSLFLTFIQLYLIKSKVDL